MCERKSFTAYQRRQIAYQQEYRCAGPCGRLLPPSFHLDHRVPLFLTQQDTVENLQALCGSCHAEKTAVENTFRGRLRRLAEGGLTQCPWCMKEMALGDAAAHRCTREVQEKRELVLNFGEFVDQFRLRR